MKIQIPLLNARPRLLLSSGIAAVTMLFLPSWLSLPARMIIAWNIGAVSFLAMVGAIALHATPELIWRRAQRQDESRFAILTFVVAAACASLLAIVFVLKDTHTLPKIILGLHITVAIITIVTSWTVIHTMFALHYAREYYCDRIANSITEVEGGLDFPHDRQPDYWDFLYFSFVIGMTSQVSDVQIISQKLRRVALIHGILSFFFNTIILAMSINILAGIL